MSTKVPSVVHPYPPVPGAPSGVGTFFPGHPFGSQSQSLLVGLEHYWTLDEASGTRNDSVGAAHLTDNDTVTSETGINGVAAKFVAANTEWLSNALPSVVPEMASDFTWSIWFKPETLTNRDTLIGIGNGCFMLEMLSTGNSASWYYVNISTEAVTTPGISVGSWNHVLAWWESSPQKQYIQLNGGTVVSRTPTATRPNSNAALYIGTQGTVRWFNGLLDEAALWNRVLTDQERALLYNSGAGKFYPSF